MARTPALIPTVNTRIKKIGKKPAPPRKMKVQSDVGLVPGEIASQIG